MPSEEPLRPYNRRPKSLAKLKLIISKKTILRRKPEVILKERKLLIINSEQIFLVL